MTLAISPLDRLQQRFAGPLLVPGDADYDEARVLFNTMIDRRPALIARAASAGDVAAAVLYAREAGLPLAVRAGGHGVSGAALVDGGVTIDLRALNTVEVDPQARTATVGGGCTWAEVDRATQAHGLATTGGRVSTTGVAGLTLGGGTGWLERRHGFACDNLIGAEMVTAEGKLLRVSEAERPELLWALRGAGANFGAVTSLTFRLHPVGPTLLAGLLLYPADRGAAVLRNLRDHMRDAPEAVGTAFAYITAPDEEEVPEDLRGERAAVVVVCHGGSLEEAEADLRDLRAFGSPAADWVEPTGYADFQCSIDDPPGHRNFWTAEYLDELSDAAIDAVEEYGLSMPKGATQTFLVPWGGAVTRHAGGSPMARREAAWVVHPLALWQDPADDEAVIAWARGLAGAVRPHASGGVYLNFIGEEGEARVRAAYGAENHDRLRALKREYDPANVFRGSHNIAPAA